MDERVSNDREGRRDWLAALLLQQHERFAPRLTTALARWRATPRNVRRRINRRVALTAAGTALVLSMTAGPLIPHAQAATITVDGATCNLVDAIIAANTDTATNGCAAGSGYDTIDLTTDVTLTSAYGYAYGADTGLPVVASVITLAGNGHTIARDGNASEFRLMAVSASGNLTLRDVTLTGGWTEESGGAVANAGGELYAFGVTFSDNYAGEFGGAVINTGFAVLFDSHLSGNRADFAGGGALNYGLMHVERSTFYDNIAYGSGNEGGGGLMNVFGVTYLASSTLSGNGAYMGGGVANFDGSAYVIESSIRDNFAIYGGGLSDNADGDLFVWKSGITDNEAYFGGGMVTANAAHTDVLNTTVSGNIGWYLGGGLANFYASLHPYHTTISNNGAYYGGGIYSDYLYVSGSAADADATGAIVEGALAGRRLDAAQRARLLAAAPDGFELDAARLARLDRLSAGGARPAGWRDGFASGGQWAHAVDAAGFRLDEAQLSGDLATRMAQTTARARAALATVHGDNHDGPRANFAYQASLSHSLVSGNWGAYGTELFSGDPGGIVAYDYNVLAHSGVSTATALVGVAPSGTDFNAAYDDGNVPLGDMIDTALAYNGGATLNHALISGSPAIDLIDHGPNHDQRHYYRPVNGQYDVGSYEYSPLSDVFVSSDSSGVTDDAVAFGPHDVLEWDDGSWATWLNGSAANLTPNGKAKHNINAIWMPDPLLSPYAMFSFAQNGRFVQGISGKVDGMDLVFWNGSTFTLMFDGQDVGLTNKSQEKIDALHVLDGWYAPDDLQAAAGDCQTYLLISTQGPGAVPGLNGPIKFSGEDILGFCMTQSGPTTKGKWIKVLDGSDEGMPRNSLANLSASRSGKTLYLMTKGAFAADSAVGGHSMIYKYDFASGAFTGPHWIAADEGLDRYVDALEVRRD